MNEFIINYLDHPIALGKEVQSCTGHPVYNFVFYKGLSVSIQMFVANMNEVQIPNSILEDMIVPDWITAMWEEMKASKKNGMWEMSELPSRKQPVDVNGFYGQIQGWW